MKNLINVIIFLIVAALVVVAVGLISKYDDSESPAKQVKQYEITVITTLDDKAVDTSKYIVGEFPTKAAAGETVTFTAKNYYLSYQIESVSYKPVSADSAIVLAHLDNAYSFEMPEEPVEILIILYEFRDYYCNISWDYKLPDDATADPFMECDVISKAKPNETVTFTVSINNPMYEIRYVYLDFFGDMLNPLDGFLEPVDGVYTFKMPNVSCTVMFRLKLAE